MKLHLPKSLRTALLACFTMVASNVTTMTSATVATGMVFFSLSSNAAMAGDVSYATNTETYNDVTYAGYIITLNAAENYTTWGASNIRFAHSGTTVTFSDGASMVMTANNGKISNQTGWHYFVGGPNELTYTAQSGHTLKLTGATKDTIIGLDFKPINLGGLIVESGNFSYKLMAASGGNQTDRALSFTAYGDNDVNLSIGANTEISIGSSTLTFNNGGTWNIAENKTLTFSATAINIESAEKISITGKGSVYMDKGSVTLGDDSELEVAKDSTLYLKNTRAGNASLINNGTTYLSGSNSIGSITNNGTLSITLAGVDYKNNSSIDLTHITTTEGSLLSLSAAGNTATPGSGSGTTVSHINLPSNIAGTIEICAGKLHIAPTSGGLTNKDTYGSPSNLGGVSGLRLNGGGIIITSQSSSFDNRQELALNIDVANEGGYIDLFGSSGSKGNEWSATHTGNITGSGTLTFIGYGEWVLAGNYNNFTGGIQFGSQCQRLYLSSDMTGLTSLLSETTQNDADVVVGYNNSNGVTISISGKETITQPNVIHLANNSTFNHAGGISIAAEKNFTVKKLSNAASAGTYKVNNIEFSNGARFSVEDGVQAEITSTAQHYSTAGEIAIAQGSKVKDNRHLTIDGTFTISGLGTYEQNGSLTISAGKALTISCDATFYGNIKAEDNANFESNTTLTATTIINAGCITANALLTANDIENSGIFTANGELNANVFTNRGEATFASSFTATGAVSNAQNASLTFNGGIITLSEVISNNGSITIQNPTDTQVVLDSLLAINTPNSVMSWVIIDNKGDIDGWDSLSLNNFIYNGETLNLGDWDNYSIVNGRVSLYMLCRYWDSVAGEDESVWDTLISSIWRDNTEDEGVLYENNSRVAFGEYEDADNINGEYGTKQLNKNVTVASSGVVAKTLDIFGRDYEFSGGNVAVTDRISIQESALFNSNLVIGSTTQTLIIDVWEGKTLTLSTLSTQYTAPFGVPVYQNGSFIKTGDGIMHITDGIHGTITSATTNGGKIELEDGVTLAVGTNILTGGSIENTDMLTRGEIIRSQTKETVTANNIIKSADGINHAILTDVTLRAGANDSFSTIQGVTFAGNSTLSGYITFEHTQQQNEMAVSSGSILTITDLTIDLHGLAAGNKVLISNKKSTEAAENTLGEIRNWDKVSYLYSGIAVNQAAIDASIDGMVTIKTDLSNNAANLYWTGAANGVWDALSTNWSTTTDTDSASVFTALSNTYFVDVTDGRSKEISINRDMVVANLIISEGGYSFSDARISSLGDTIIDVTSGDVTFNNNRLDTQGTLSSSGTGALTFNTIVTAGEIQLEAGSISLFGNVSVGNTLNINAGSDMAHGNLNIGGHVQAENINIAVSAGNDAASDYGNIFVQATGQLTAADTITIGGTASQKYEGTVTADALVITNTTHDVYFNDVQVQHLEVAEGARVHIQKNSVVISESNINNVSLGGSLYLDAYAAIYNKGYNITSNSDHATLILGTGVTVQQLQLHGTAGSMYDGGFSDLSIESSARYVTITGMSNLGNLSIRTGTLTVQNATESIHGQLNIIDNGGLKVTGNNIMANGSGQISIDRGTLELNNTEQTLRAGNTLNMASSTISGDSLGRGLNYIENGCIQYSGRNIISANIRTTENTILNINAAKQVEDMLTLSGTIFGNGNINMTGDGTVALSNSNDFSGTITVSDITTLAVLHTNALANATLKVEADAVLYADMSSVTLPYNIGILDLRASEAVTLNEVPRTAGIIQIHELAATDVASDSNAAFHVDALQSNAALTLDILLGFNAGHSLETMKTYNLFTSESELNIDEINISLHIINNNTTTHVADSQYKLGYDEESHTIYIRTMLGNIWDGGADGDGSGIWSKEEAQVNWSGKSYIEDTEYNDAIFVDITNVANATVTIEGVVEPGDVYIEADHTHYTIVADGVANYLAEGTNIHKSGNSDATITLAETSPALGNIDVQKGKLVLSNNSTTSGHVTVANEAELYVLKTLTNEYFTASGTFSGLTIKDAGISGTDTLGRITNGRISGNAKLSALTLSGTGILNGVTIGESINIDNNGDYTLDGSITYNNTITSEGSITFAGDVILELGQMIATDLNSYQLVQGGTIIGYENLTASHLTIRGINLATDLAEGITATATATEQGILNITFEGASIMVPTWDSRWNKENAPALTHLYNNNTEDSVNLGEFDYSALVSNGDTKIAVTLSSSATGPLAAGGTAGNRESWVNDNSAIATVIAGTYNGTVSQSADTHLLVDTTHTKDVVVGGSYGVDQTADSYLTIRNGEIILAVGGSYTANQTGTSHIYVDGGNIHSLYAAGYESNLNVGTDKRAVELLLTGGTHGATNQNIYGGGYAGKITGDIHVTVDGNAQIASALVGGSYGGSVTGNIVINLVSGTATQVYAAGSNNTAVSGNVLVNLYHDFDISGGTIYGGKQQNSGVSTFTGTSTLHFAEAGKYELGKTSSYHATQDSVAIAGFDVWSLADDAYVVIALSRFDKNAKNRTEALTIQGHGTVEIIEVGSNFGRNVTLSNGATLKISTSAIGETKNLNDDYTITATNGTTIDFSGFPIEANGGPSSLYSGVGFNSIISGDGVNGKGAIYKGEFLGEYNKTEETGGNNPSGKISLPKIELSDNASIVVTDGEYLYMNQSGLATSNLNLNGNTLTKRGEGSFITRTVAISDGTVLIQEGIFGVDLAAHGENADMVIATGSSLQLASTSVTGQTSFEIRSLNGNGEIVLNGSPLTLHTTTTAQYYDKYLDENQSYDQFLSTTGFAYGVFSGVMKDGKAPSILNKNGNGVHYLSGSESTYSGGTHMIDGCLYLLGSSTENEFNKGTSTVSAGVAGTGAIVWENSTAELYLGHGIKIFNAGTTNVAGGMMTIGVEGAPVGTLSDFVGIHSAGENDLLEYVTMGGEEYVEIDTHNLQSISVNAMYADGTNYVAGSEIDRNKMLLIKDSEWDTARNASVTGFTETGYNEATYSGILSDSIVDGKLHAAGLRKVGVGTLILDQANTYTGNTIIEQGTLSLQGWAQLGAASDNLYVDQQDKTSLKLSYDGSYGDEITEISNNIAISGKGDSRWDGDSATDGKTAALISDVGSAVKFTLSGNISGDGNVLHSGDGTLVLSGNSTYTGGTEATRGTVEVQSATGLGATANGTNKVIIAASANLKASVKDGYTDNRMATTLAADDTDIQGDVTIQGAEMTERILHMATNGYQAQSTTANENGTLLVNGESISATTAHLTGRGKVAVSDATGNGASANIGTMVDYSGDFVVEGPKASINTNSGNFIGGSISVQGQDASVNIGGNVTISSGQELVLVSNGTARKNANTAAMISSGGILSIAGGATFAVSNDDTEYHYNLQELQKNTSLSMADTVVLPDSVQGDSYYQISKGDTIEFSGFFDKNLAVNQQAVGAVNAANGLVLSGGSAYETDKANTSLMGGSLTLATSEDSLISFITSTEMDLAAALLKNPSLQLVLFTDVSSVTFGTGTEAFTTTEEGVYYALANQYLTGSPYIGDETLLVYDAHVGVVYLDRAIPEPTTATLSLLALAALAARRRRK